MTTLVLDHSGHMDAFFQLGMLHLRWANGEHSEVEELQKRHRQLAAQTQQHQKEALRRQQQQRQRERARIKAGRKRQLKERAEQKQRQRQEAIEQRRAAREKFNARMSPEDATAADTLAAEVNADGDVGDVSGLEDEDEAPGDVDGSDDDDTDFYDNEDADSRAADEARRAAEKQKQETEAAVARKAKSVAQNLQKGLQFLTTAAQNGHLLALHQVGVLYQTGRGVSKSCGTAAHAFKSVGERAAEPTAVVTAALQLWQDGDMEGARLL